MHKELKPVSNIVMEPWAYRKAAQMEQFILR